MDKEFSVAIISRQDILDCYELDDKYEEIEKKVENLSDEQVQKIAYGIGDIVFNHGSYYSWWDNIMKSFEKESA